MASEPREVWGDLVTSAFVQASLLFKSLDEEAREDLLKLAQSLSFGPGEAIVTQGQPGEFFFLIQDGNAVITFARDGQSVDLGSLERGAFFGEFHVLTGAPHMATVTARTELSLVRFPSDIIVALLDRFPKVRKLLEAVKTAREKETAAKLGGGGAGAPSPAT
jgi:CRP-like cAMP-binding protein